MQDEPGARNGSSDRGAPGVDAGRTSLPAAGGRLFAASWHVAVAVVALLAAEARLFKQHVGLAFLGGVALIALAVALWGCVVALIGWAFRVATGSTGIALALLVALHLILIVASWFSIKGGIHQASFPETRAELAALRRGLRRSAGGSRTSAAASGNDSAAP